jgi:hypothetical protein
LCVGPAVVCRRRSGSRRCFSAAEHSNVNDRTWHLHTKDCFFGVCNYTLHLVQHRHTITSTPGSGISGSIRAPHITINFTGVSSEDDWTCSGKLNATFTVFSGTFTDGTGGSGSCRATRAA